MEAEVANSISSFGPQSPPMHFSSSTIFTIQHSVNMCNLIADSKIHKGRKQTALPRKEIYIEREKLCRMEISAPMPNSAFQVQRLHHTNEMQVNTNNSYEMRKTSKRNANKIELHPKQLTLDKSQVQEDTLAARLFEDRVLPELKANLPLPQSTVEDVLSFELQPRVPDAQCTYASIYEIPPAAQTWQRGDCLRDRNEQGLLIEIMQEINMRNVSTTKSTTGSDKSKIMKEQMNLDINGGIARLNRSSNETAK